MNEVKLGSKLIYAENPDGNFLNIPLPTEQSLAGMPKVYRDYTLLNTGYSPFDKKKFYFSPTAPGETPSKEFQQVETKLKNIAENRMKQLKTNMNPNEVSVQTENGLKLNCRRGTPIKTEVEFLNIKSELSCELFSCGGIDEEGKHFDTLLHFASDVTRQSGNGAGTGGPFLFAVKDKNEAKTLKIKEIHSNQGLLYTPPEKADQWAVLAVPDGFAALAKTAGIPSIAPELQVLHYRVVLDSLASNCNGIEPAWAKLQSHYLNVRSVSDKKTAILLVEKISGALKSRLISPSSLSGEVCHLGEDTYIRPDALSDLSPLLFEARQMNPISEEEAQDLFKEVAAMSDVPHEFSGSGCEARAHIVTERLKARGYPVQKIWAKGGNLSPYKGQSDTWTFHVATAIPVTTKDGKVEWRVLDPTLADKPVDTKNWLRRFQPSAEGNGVWTQWPPPIGPGQGFAKTIVYLSPPEIYFPEDTTYPDAKRREQNQKTALRTIQDMQKNLMHIRSNPKEAYGGFSPPTPLVSREAP